MRRWEYQYLGFSSDDLDAINRIGAEGWEMVAAHPYSLSRFEAIFKRPLSPETPEPDSRTNR